MSPGTRLTGEEQAQVRALYQTGHCRARIGSERMHLNSSVTLGYCSFLRSRWRYSTVNETIPIICGRISLVGMMLTSRILSRAIQVQSVWHRFHQGAHSYSNVSARTKMQKSMKQLVWDDPLRKCERSRCSNICAARIASDSETTAESSRTFVLS